MVDKKINNRTRNQNRKRRSQRERKRQQRIRRIIAMASILVIIIVVLCIKFIPKQENKVIQIGKPNNVQALDDGNSEFNDDDNDEQIEDNNLNNSGYLTLENDPNADDASIVEENTKGLLNGTKTYPVRTDGKKVVYLTFDDGPSTTNTPQVLDVLKEYNVKGTFFVLGKSIEANDEAKDILKDIAKSGHAIANHTYSHDYSYLYPNRVMNVGNIISDIEKNNNLMKEVIGEDFSTRVVRFPGGYWSWDGRTPMKEKMIEKGFYNIDWNTLNKDAEGKPKNASELVQCTKEGVELLGPNADSVVLLMHDTYGKEETVKALPQIIEYFKSEGFEFRTIK